MSNSQRIAIRGEDDVILARMKTRNLARAAGLGIADQARISLAASSLAHTMELGSRFGGHILIECLDGDGRPGVRIVCTAANAADGGQNLGALRDTKWLLMVDELTVETLPTSDVQVIAVKWAI